MIGIGELARRTGVSVRMLRYYETAGLLRPARSAAGQRRFEPTDVSRVRRIVLLNRSGLTLERIRPLVDCTVGSDTAPLCPALAATLKRTLGDIEDRISDLAATRAVLASLLGAAAEPTRAKIAGAAPRALA